MTSGYRVVGADEVGEDGDGVVAAVETDVGDTDGVSSGIDVDDDDVPLTEAVVARERVLSVDRERARYAELLIVLPLPLLRVFVTIMGGLACTVSSYRRATRCEDREGDVGEDREEGDDVNLFVVEGDTGEHSGADMTDVEDGEDRLEADILGVNLGFWWRLEVLVLPPPTLLNRCSVIV